MTIMIAHGQLGRLVLSDSVPQRMLGIGLATVFTTNVMQKHFLQCTLASAMQSPETL